MSNYSIHKALSAKVSLDIMPPLIRNTLLQDSTFCDDHGLKADVVITFEPVSLSISRAKLFDAIRSVLSDMSEVIVTDVEGQEWKLVSKNENPNEATLELSHEGGSLLLPDLTLLSPNPQLRIRSFKEQSSENNLPSSVKEDWLNIIAQRPLRDHEVTEFKNDLYDTPIYVAQSLRRKFEIGEVGVSDLVPDSRRYYERLIGIYDGSASIKEYATRSARQVMTCLSSLSPYDGFSLSLLLSAHSSLTQEIQISGFSSEELSRTYDLIAKHGDRLSQIGAIEVGLRILPEFPIIEPFIVSLIEQIRDENVDDSDRGFQLLSALFILVDGELSEKRLFPCEPPFYRRLASLAQAALIHRQLMNTGVGETFRRWAINICGEQYYLQTLVDMRKESRWNPDFADARLLKAEFLGRIVIAAQKYPDGLSNASLDDLINGTNNNSLSSLAKSISLFFPGPLEGADAPPMTLPVDYYEIIETQLNANELTEASFIGLINLANFFQIDDSLLDLAVNVLQKNNYGFSKLEDKSQLFYLLSGLADVAAVCRKPELATASRLLTRRYRQNKQYSLSIDETLKIGITAAASYEDTEKWQVFIGEWMTEMAFGELKENESRILHSRLQYLCYIVPELWFSCSRADAALRAYNAIS
ncbi:hypothetical protein IQ273_07675 [Nodosilinea sp. LEGE 07298]|uniref:hypothetical protein n=1 Tax=Nodosilinea sp. LEGE 07298 TaxID=2777970 RepID=UPI00187F512D|nr:hypothetical protein [Nodosilinea sp. LEGE 07298]MBE9109292.1 hypothetical protein [Nodosilinea sp. LEGE 07298]